MIATQTRVLAPETLGTLQLRPVQGDGDQTVKNQIEASAAAAGDGVLSSHPSTAPEPEATDLARAYATFLQDYPAYKATSALDDLRASDYARLDGAETYVDYMGGSLFPEGLLQDHMRLLLESGNLFGNAHSRSESSRRSSELAYRAREAVLQFVDADKDDYAVIFTPNATGALKLVGESFPFGEASSLLLPMDAHNSVHGIRVFAETNGTSVKYYGCGPRGGVNMESLQVIHTPCPSCSTSLLVITGQSNVTAAKAPLQDILPMAREAGLYTLLDAAALVPTTKISLRKTPVDACAISFYKICGYPTGLGALIVKRSFSRNVMRRVWFAGGTVTAVQVPGTGPTSYHFWEDGTINYLGLPAVQMGLEVVTRYRDVLPQRLTILTHALSSGIARATHPNGAPLAHVVSTLPDLEEPGASGSVVACIFLNASGTPIRNDVVERSARQSRIALRTGCMCNPGARNLHLGLNKEVGDLLFDGDSSFGLIRISLGLVSNFEDVWKVLSWVINEVPKLSNVAN
ncbi:PLP-dependent transferase [Auricularia subglabra TFB-10046 SS5]|uniref:PLP-dependent transferase n=1 Tax=Auricularia subglabra (strain TFB-10046 / SS5) TaxID=717982 RepID=J0LGI4_AURST|nr:PLP-dependent transferase [Auricularia subglabra TFB-10046 SS5]